MQQQVHRKVGSQVPPSHRIPFDNGSWLCTDGPYRKLVAAWCSISPIIHGPDPKNKWSPLIIGNARVVMLELDREKAVRRTDFSSSAELVSHFDHERYLRNHEMSRENRCFQRRIYVVEGLAPDYISALGGYFLMDPTFFVRHERTINWGHSYQGTRQTPTLPSSMQPRKSFLMKYYELRDFHNIETFNMWCARTGRNINVSKNTRPELMSTKLDPIGIVHRKCSFWSRENEDRSWDAVILCDPPIERVFFGSANINRSSHHNDTDRDGRPSVHELHNAMQSTPYSGGYVDFIPHSDPISGHSRGPPRGSMLEDICFYWLTHSQKLIRSEDVSIATVFIKKIAASHYMQLVEFIRSNICGIEYQMLRRERLDGISIPWVEEQWNDVQAWSQRCSEYVGEIEALMLGLGISPADDSARNQEGDWTDCEKDFRYLHSRLKTLKTRVDLLISSLTGLAGIAGNRQALAESRRSLREAKGIKTLTLLGMVFLPLAFSCSLFSTNDQYLPGAASFWMLFAVSIPLIILVFSAVWIVNQGYAEDGSWTLKQYSDKFGLKGRQ